MENYIKETDLLGGEGIEETRKNLLPKWFYILLAIFTLFLAYRIANQCVFIYKWYMAMNIGMLNADELSGMRGGLTTHVVLAILKVPAFLACLGLFLQKKKAVAIAIVLFIVHLVIESFGLAAQLHTYLQYDFSLNGFILGILLGAIELIVVWIMIRQLRKIRKRWPLAVSSHVHA
jgi:hypothetical protein